MPAAPRHQALLPAPSVLTIMWSGAEMPRMVPMAWSLLVLQSTQMLSLASRPLSNIRARRSATASRALSPVAGRRAVADLLFRLAPCRADCGAALARAARSNPFRCGLTCRAPVAAYGGGACRTPGRPTTPPGINRVIANDDYGVSRPARAFHLYRSNDKLHTSVMSGSFVPPWSVRA